MKHLQFFILITAAGLVLALLGCTKDHVLTPIQTTTDEQALQQEVTSVDSVADYSSSDESTIDDNGMRSPEYDGFAKVDADDLTRIAKLTADSIYPVKWGRHIFWDQVTRDFNVLINPGDSSAIVTITKTLPGQFWIGLGTRTSDTVIVDSVIKKPFIEVVKRKVRFIRIARSENPFRNWVPVAITMVLGKTKPDSLNHFAIASLEIERIGLFDTTFTDPLQTWFRLGLFHGSIPRYIVGDSIRVTATLNSANDSAEIVHLRYGIVGDALDRRRTNMHLISTGGSTGSWVRVYQRTFIARLPRILPPGVLAARFNALVDVISYGSIYINSDPFTNEFWGSPYIVVR